MTPPTAAEVRAFILEHLRGPLLRTGLEPSDVPADYDLLDNGVTDSFGLLELIGEVEERFGIEVDFERLEPEEIPRIDRLAAFIAAGG